ncbi:MAG: DinB family protein [Flavisolibacter sp.]
MKEVFIKMALDAWQTYQKRTEDLFNELPDAKLANEVSPGRNSGIYLLGHLTAVHDSMMPLLGSGEPLYPALRKPFIEQPDKAATQIPSTAELRQYWKTVNERLTEAMGRLKSDDWFTRHNAVSEEDFKKEPHRNKLNIIINRTNHLASHYGQLLFLKEKQ